MSVILKNNNQSKKFRKYTWKYKWPREKTSNMAKV